MSRILNTSFIFQKFITKMYNVNLAQIAHEYNKNLLNDIILS